MILALDLYFRAGRKQLPPAHPDVAGLSKLLNSLPIHAPLLRNPTFRNPEGISMVLGNFLGVDPEQAAVGLGRNNHLHEEVWAEFSAEPEVLRQVAQAIERAGELLADPETQSGIPDEVFREGELLTRLHVAFERNRTAVERKKEHILASSGRLECEACGFDFAAVYGDGGRGFAECHHVLPLAKLPGLRETRLSDLAVVCANCHRMLHRLQPQYSVDDLRELIVRQKVVR